MRNRYYTENEVLQMKIENALHQVQRIILIAVLLLLLAALAWVLTIRAVSKQGLAASGYTYQVAVRGDLVKVATWSVCKLPSFPPGMALFPRSADRRTDMSGAQEIGQPRACIALTGLLYGNSAVIVAMTSQVKRAVNCGDLIG